MTLIVADEIFGRRRAIALRPGRRCSLEVGEWELPCRNNWVSKACRAVKEVHNAKKPASSNTSQSTGYRRLAGLVALRGKMPKPGDRFFFRRVGRAAKVPGGIGEPTPVAGAGAEFPDD